MFEVRLIRVEGISDFNSCDLMLDGKNVDRLYPACPGKSFLIDSFGKYQIIVARSEGIYSVSFCVELFQDDGMMWLPLYWNSDKFVKDLLENVQGPRVLLLVRTKDVEELCSGIFTEENENTEDFLLDLSECHIFPEVFNPVLCSRDDENLEKSTIFQRKIEGNGENITKMLESQEYVENIPFLEEKIEVLEEKVDVLEEKIEVLEEKTGVLEEKIEGKIIYELEEKGVKCNKLEENKIIAFQTTLTERKTADLAILKEIEAKNKALSQRFSEILQLNHEIQKKELENLYLKSMQTQKIMEKTDEILQEIAENKEKISNFRRKNANSAKITLQTEESLFEDRAIQDQVDIECKRLKIPPLGKSEEGIYNYHNTKLLISLQNGKLMCRFGENYKDFKQHMAKLSFNYKPILGKYTSKSNTSTSLEFSRDLKTPIDMLVKKEMQKPRSSQKISPRGKLF